MQGMLPDEMLLDWGRTGRMYYPGTRKTRQLEPAERIACIRACMPFYKHPKAAVQPADAPPQVMRFEIDDRALAALVQHAPDQATMFANVLRMIQSGGADLPQLAQQQGGADPARYGRMLSESSETAGRA